MTNRAAHVLVFFSSGAVLVLEILAGRLMAPYVGVSLETFTGIIGTILAGIAAGSAIGGRLADRISPARMLGPTLVVGGALSAVAVWVIAALGPSLGPGPASIVILAAFSFLAPTTVLSAVSPMVAKLRLSNLEDTGRVVGSLSASGTAGALFGTFITGFVLVAAVPTRPLVLGVASLLVLVGLVLWWTIGPRSHRATGLVALAIIGLSASTPDYCEVESAYSCIRIVVDPDRPTGRSLYLADLRNSYVDLEDPTYLEFRYFRLAADVVATVPEGPLRVLHIGGAGFTFPRYIEAIRPDSDQLVLEIDGTLVDVARSELGLVTGPGLEVAIGDARLSLADASADTYDVVIGDVFSGLSVPWHLTTVEVMQEIEETLTADGLYLANIIDGGEHRFLRAELATLAETFGHVAVIVPPGSSSSYEAGPVVDRIANFVVVASNQPLVTADVDPADGIWWDEASTRAFIGSAEPLTDDYAPADQLLQGR